MGKNSTNQPGKKRKVFITFNEDARKEYLTGFRKRKQERKVKAQGMLEKKLKDKIKQERNKRRKTTKEKVAKLLEGINLPGDEDDKIEQSEMVDFGTHEGIVKTCVDYGDSGLVLAPSQHDEQVVNSSQSGTKRKKDKKTKYIEKPKKRKKKVKQKR